MQPPTHEGRPWAELWRLAHLGSVQRERFDDALWADLCAVELAQEPGIAGALS